jgi:hypothetical protein
MRPHAPGESRCPTTGRPASVAAWPLALLLLLGGGPGALGFAGEQAAAAESNSEDEVEAETGEKDQKGREKAPPSRRFTDEDLEKYHRPRPAPQPGEGESGETGAEKTARAAPPPPREIRPHAPLVRTPLKIAVPPSRDPLKKFKAREAREKFRTDQILGLRDRIARLESRLEYLRQKRIAIVDPLNLMPRAPAGEETGSETGLKPQELLKKVEADIESVTTELETAREQLVEIETRFGHEANLP